MPTSPPELTKHGLVLWRLRWASDRQLWCEGGDFAGELVLRVDNLATGQTTVSEVHETIESAIGRADSLRDQFIAAGWQEVDVDLDEPD